MSRVPAFAAALAFALGVWFGNVAWRPPLWSVVALLAWSAAALTLVRSRRFAYGAALLSLAALGALDVGARDQGRAVQERERAIQPLPATEEVSVTGHALRDSTSRQRGSSTSEVVDVETECVSTITQVPVAPDTATRTTVEPQPLPLTEDGPSIYSTLATSKPRSNGRRRAAQKTEPLIGPCVPAVAGIRVTVYPHDVTEDADDPSPAKVRTFQYGERIRFRSRLRQPRNFDNPGAWDYAGYLRAADISLLGSAREDRVERLSGSGGSRAGAWRARVRRNILAKIDSLWQAPRAGLIAAMVVGEKSELRRNIRADFQRTGVYHILVVSGMNVGILAFVVFWVLKRLRIGEMTSSAVTVVLSVGYALITDGGAPILRATLMLAIYLGARLLYRDRAPLNAVGLAGLILLVVDPRALFDASFQLTFVSVVAIAGIAVPLLERTAEPYRRALHHLDSIAYDMTLPPRQAQFRLDLRLLEGKAAALIGRHASRFALTGTVRAVLGTLELIAVSAVAQCALALPMAVYFHRAVLVGLPANLIVVPLTGVLMPAATAAVALAYLSPVVAKPAAWITAWALDAINATIRIVGGWRASEWRIASPDTSIAVFCIIAIAFCLLVVRRQRWLAAVSLAALTVSAAMIALVPPARQVHPGKLEFTAIDVGQADSTLVITPEGRTLLVDAAGSFGPFQSEFDFGEDVISPYLWSRGISRLDAVAITHGHSDHIGGMRSVIANFRPRELWVGPNAPDRALDDLLQTARAMDALIVYRNAPEEFVFGGAKMRVLSPPPDWQTADRVRNEDSMVIRVSYGTTSALITGDADKKMEERMLAEGPRASVLHVAHNGSASSTSPEFLQTVQPQYAVISVGVRNQFRHPRPEVLERLAALGVVTFRTDLNGAISFLLDGEEVSSVLPSRRLQ